MTISMAILLIIILLLYDFMFLKMLLNRKRKIKFSIYIENGKIQSTEGDITAKFLSDTKDLCKIYKPGKIKIMAVLNKGSHKLQFSGTLPDELKSKLLASWNKTLSN